MSETSPRPAAAEAPAPPAPLDLAEKGRRNGQEIALDRRLFMKFTAFGRCFDPHAAVAALREDGARGAVYLDANDPQGIGVMIASENPEYFVTNLRSVFSHQRSRTSCIRTSSTSWPHVFHRVRARPRGDAAQTADEQDARREECLGRLVSAAALKNFYVAARAQDPRGLAPSRYGAGGHGTTCGSRAMGSTRTTTTSSWVARAEAASAVGGRARNAQDRADIAIPR
jgi:hypothetical protein